MPPRIKGTLNRLAVLVALLVALSGCVSSTGSLSTAVDQGDVPDHIDTRIVELEAKVAGLQAEIQTLEARGDVYTAAFERNVAQLEAAMSELREQARQWISLADEFGELAEGPGYWWAQAPVRGCSTTVSGALTPAESDVEVGPLLLGGAGSYAEQLPDVFEPVEEGLYRGHKILMILEDVVDVLVLVPDHERANVSLLYQAYRLDDPTRVGGVPLAIPQGERAVIFQGCPGRSQGAQYDGGLAVAGPRCVTLEVYVGASTLADEISLGFGTECPAG